MYEMTLEAVITTARRHQDDRPEQAALHQRGAASSDPLHRADPDRRSGAPLPMKFAATVARAARREPSKTWCMRPTRARSRPSASSRRGALPPARRFRIRLEQLLQLARRLLRRLDQLLLVVADLALDLQLLLVVHIEAADALGGFRSGPCRALRACAAPGRDSSEVEVSRIR